MQGVEEFEAPRRPRHPLAKDRAETPAEKAAEPMAVARRPRRARRNTPASSC